MKLLSTKEAADRLGIDESRVRRLIAAGKLPAMRIGLRAHAINEDDLALVVDRKPGRPKKPDEAEAIEASRKSASVKATKKRTTKK